MPTHGTYTRSLTVEASFSGGHAELAIVGELNEDTRAILSDMLALVLGKQPSELVVNMRRVRTADEASLRMLAGTAAGLPGDRTPVIVHPSTSVRSLLHAAGLDMSLPVADTPEGIPARSGPFMRGPRANSQRTAREPASWR